MRRLRAVRLGGSSVLRTMGFSFLAAFGMTDVAERWFKFLARRAPDERASLHAELAEVYERAGNNELARSNYEDAIRLAPGDGYFRILLGSLLEQIGANDEAVEQYRSGLALPHGLSEEYVEAIERKISAG